MNEYIGDLDILVVAGDFQTRAEGDAACETHLAHIRNTYVWVSMNPVIAQLLLTVRRLVSFGVYKGRAASNQYTTASRWKQSVLQYKTKSNHQEQKNGKQPAPADGWMEESKQAHNTECNIPCPPTKKQYTSLISKQGRCLMNKTLYNDVMQASKCIIL